MMVVPVNSFGICSVFAGKDPIQQKELAIAFWTGQLCVLKSCVELFCFHMLSPEIQILRSTYLQWVPWLAIFAKNTLCSKSLAAPISCQVGLGFGDAESETWQQAVIHGIPSSIPGVDSVRWCCTKSEVSLLTFGRKCVPQFEDAHRGDTAGEVALAALWSPPPFRRWLHCRDGTSCWGHGFVAFEIWNTCTVCTNNYRV